jgi:hypothetical protein
MYHEAASSGLMSTTRPAIAATACGVRIHTGRCGSVAHSWQQQQTFIEPHGAELARAAHAWRMESW